MNSRYKITKAMQWLVATAALGLTCLAQAVEAYKVTLDTSSLVGDPLGAAPYYIDFQLISGGAPGNNWVTISDIMLSGGSVEASINIQGGASGNLTSGVQLTDTDFINDFYQEFIPGSSLSFVVTLTNNANPGDFADAFSFSILDSFLGFPANIPTESFSYTLLEVNIDGSPLVFEASAGIDDYQGITAPGVTPVPEPSTYGIFAGMALAGLAYWRRRGRSGRSIQ